MTAYPDLSKPLPQAIATSQYPDLSTPNPVAQNYNKTSMLNDPIMGMLDTARNNISAGLMSGIQGFGKLAYQATSPMFPGPHVNPLNNFDPYAINKTTEAQHWYTPQGLEQLIGNLVSGGVAAPGVNAAISNTANLFRPGKASSQFVQSLGQGTAEENLADLAKRLQFARSSAETEALAHKAPVFDDLGDKPIVNYAENKFGAHGEKLEPDYSDSEYLTYANENDLTKDFPKKLQDLHSSFVQNPTLNNADALQMQIGSRIGDLRDASLKAPLDQKASDELNNLKIARDKILGDQDKFMQTQDPKYQMEYNLFRQKWRENVSPFDKNPVLSQVSRKGSSENLTPSSVNSIFYFPEGKPYAQLATGQIGPSGEGNILYNELVRKGISPTNSEAVRDAMTEMKQRGGYQSYITPGMEDAMHSWINKERANLGLGAGVAGLGLSMGHPIIGGLIGASISGKPLLQKLLELKYLKH